MSPSIGDLETVVLPGLCCFSRFTTSLLAQIKLTGVQQKDEMIILGEALVDPIFSIFCAFNLDLSSSATKSNSMVHGFEMVGDLKPCFPWTMQLTLDIYMYHRTMQVQKKGLLEDKMENNEMGIMGMPPGFKFAPTDDEVIRYFLSNKVHGHQCPWLSIIPEFDLYSESGPWDLLHSDESPVYVFSTSKNVSKERKQRTCRFGTWKFQKMDEVEHEGQLIGYKSLLTFMPDEAKIDPHQLGGSWHMSEFSLLDSKDKECFVLCRVSFKSGRDVQTNKKRSRQGMIKNKTPATKKARTATSKEQGFEQYSGDTPAVEADAPLPYSSSNPNSEQAVAEQFIGAAIDAPYSSAEQVGKQGSSSVVPQEPSSSWSVMTMEGNFILAGGGGGAGSVQITDGDYNPDLAFDLNEIDADLDEDFSFWGADPSYNNGWVFAETDFAAIL